MSEYSVYEWGRVKIGNGGISTDEAASLVAAARAHSHGGEDGANILTDHRHYLHVKQMVGVIAAPTCSLEILPKVDLSDTKGDNNAPTVRGQLIRLLSLALNLDIFIGGPTSLARQNESLLDILIRSFAHQLLELVRRGLPRQYTERGEDLPALRGSLNVIRQFTTNSVRPDRLASKYDELSADTPFMRILKGTVIYLASVCRVAETHRLLHEARFALAEVSDVSYTNLPWDRVRLDRKSKHWSALLNLAALLVRRDWQTTHRGDNSRQGLSLLFPMNSLFEAAITAVVRQIFSGTSLEVAVQGGRRYCLGEVSDSDLCSGSVFLTKPDLVLRRNSEVVAVIDTKWKRVSSDPLDQKHGVTQADVYQMMAYARIYQCRCLLLIYPAVPGAGAHIIRQFGIAGGIERLTIACIDVSASPEAIRVQLKGVLGEILEVGDSL